MNPPIRKRKKKEDNEDVWERVVEKTTITVDLNDDLYDFLKERHGTKGMGKSMWVCRTVGDRSELDPSFIKLMGLMQEKSNKKRQNKWV